MNRDVIGQDFQRQHGLIMPAMLLMAAICYNAVLSIVNAYAVTITPSYVALSEMLIILAGLGCIFLNVKRLPNMAVPLIFLVFMFAVFIYVSFMNDGFYIKSYRDILLIAVFFCLGRLVTTDVFVKTFRFLTIIVLFFMLMEIFFTDLYATIFQPASYYANTRGIEELSTDSSGLFRNSLGYGDRFSFGLFDTHRVSSIFLEQVSLANFAMVLGVFLCVFWSNLKNFDRVLFGLAIPLMVLSNSSRTASFICILLLAGYFIFPRLPRYSHALWIPLILIASAIFFYDPEFQAQGMSDDMKGRIGHTMQYLSRLNEAYFTGGSIGDINRTGDTGYTYLIYTQTIFGAIAFWLYVSFCLPPANAENRRFQHATALYIGVNLLIGAAIFSIKVSAPLWFIAGYLYQKSLFDSAQGSSHENA